jgi:hypothetical protein
MGHVSLGVDDIHIKAINPAHARRQEQLAVFLEGVMQVKVLPHRRSAQPRSQCRAIAGLKLTRLQCCARACQIQWCSGFDQRLRVLPQRPLGHRRHNQGTRLCKAGEHQDAHAQGQRQAKAQECDGAGPHGCTIAQADAGCGG